MTDDVLLEHIFGDDPAMRVKWRYTKTNSELVVLISELLELVDAALPESRELNLDAFPCNDAVCL
jgi:hypothetical protein